MAAAALTVTAGGGLIEVVLLLPLIVPVGTGTGAGERERGALMGVRILTAGAGVVSSGVGCAARLVPRGAEDGLEPEPAPVATLDTAAAAFSTAASVSAILAEEERRERGAGGASSSFSASTSMAATAVREDEEARPRPLVMVTLGASSSSSSSSSLSLSISGVLRVRLLRRARLVGLGTGETSTFMPFLRDSMYSLALSLAAASLTPSTAGSRDAAAPEVLLLRVAGMISQLFHSQVKIIYRKYTNTQRLDCVNRACAAGANISSSL